MNPLPFQIAGAHALASRTRLYLADQQGLGKTLQALLALKELGTPSNAILCPAIARTMWRTLYQEVLGVPAEFVESYDRYVGNPQVREELKRLDPAVLILDEAHMLGNLGSQRTLALLGRDGPARRATVVWPMSGTPLRGGPQAAFPLLAALWPNELRRRGITTFREYLDRYTHYYDHPKYGVRVRGTRNEVEWNMMWNGIALRRTFEEVLPQFPPITWETLVMDVDPTTCPAELAAYRKAEQEADWSAVHAALAAGGLPDSWGPSMPTLRRLIGEAKAPFSARLIAAELDGGVDKVFVSAYHLNVLDRLERELTPYGVCRIDGSTPEKEREKAMLRFQLDPSVRVFLGQIVATMTAITLTAAAHVHQVEPMWEPDDNDQNARRVYRIGQGRPVIVKQHVLAGTIDEAVGAALLRKQRIKAMLGLGTLVPPTTRQGVMA